MDAADLQSVSQSCALLYGTELAITAHHSHPVSHHHHHHLTITITKPPLNLPPSLLSPHKHRREQHAMATPLIHNLIASSAACLEHCSACSTTCTIFATLATTLHHLKPALALAAEVALYSSQSPLFFFQLCQLTEQIVFLAAELELMADAPVDSLRRLLLVPELDEYRTRFLAAVVVMDQQRAVQFEDIPRYCYDRLEALVGDAGAGDVEDVVAAVTPAGDTHGDVTCEITEVVVPVAAAEGEIDENMTCKAAVVVVPATTLNDNIYKDTACETIPVASEDRTHQDTASKIPAPEDCNHEATAHETIVAIIPTTAASESHSCENTVREITAEGYTHEDAACKTIPVVSEDRTHQDTTSKAPALEDYNYKVTACEITTAVVDSSHKDSAPDVAVASKGYTHGTTFEITAQAEDYTHETRACELPAATT